MKKIILILIGLLLGGALSVQAVTVFNSSQVGTSASNGYVLQTNGTNSTWVATSTLATSSNTANITVTSAPYNASGSLATTTTSATINAGATSVAVVDGSSFKVNQGIYIKNAGVTNINSAIYIGTITSINGNTLAISPATSQIVSSGTLVQHDDTAAIQSAITALGTNGGKIYIPAGYYRVNGPSNGSNDLNAAIIMPSILNNDSVPQIPIEIDGQNNPSTNANVSAGVSGTTTAQTVIQSDATTTNIIGGYSTGNVSNVTNVWLTLQNMVFRTYPNPAIIAVDANGIGGLDMNNVLVDDGLPEACGYGYGGCTRSISTNTGSSGVSTPKVSNTAEVNLTNVRVMGYYTGINAHEHADMSNTFVNFAHYCLYVYTTGHGVNFNRFQCEQSYDGIYGQATTLTGSVFSDEGMSGYDVDDSSNAIYGHVTFSDSTTAPNLTINGAKNLRIENGRNGTISNVSNLGIGTSTPIAPLSVSTVAQQAGTLPLFTVASTTNSNLFTVYGNDDVSINNAPSNHYLNISSSLNGDNLINITNTSGGASAEAAYDATNNGGQVMNFGITGDSYGGYGAITAGSGFEYATTPFTFMSDSNSGYINFAVGQGGVGSTMQINHGNPGSVGIATTTTPTTLTVQGSVSVYKSAATSTVYIDGSLGGTIIMKDEGGLVTCTAIATVAGVIKGSVVNCPF